MDSNAQVKLHVTALPLAQLATSAVEAHGQLAASHGQAAELVAGQLAAGAADKAARRAERVAALRARDHSAAAANSS